VRVGETRSDKDMAPGSAVSEKGADAMEKGKDKNRSRTIRGGTWQVVGGGWWGDDKKNKRGEIKKKANGSSRVSFLREESLSKDNQRGEDEENKRENL